MMVPTAQSQKVATVKSYTKKEFRFYSDTIRRVTVKTVKVAVMAPQPETGFKKSNGYGQSRDTVYVDYDYVRFDSSFVVKNYNTEDFKHFSANYYNAYKNPGQKIYNPNQKPEEFIIYSNYFLTKEVGTKEFWVIYHTDTKAPYFELGVDKKSEMSFAWGRLLGMLCAMALLAYMFVNKIIVGSNLALDFASISALWLTGLCMNILIGLVFMLLYDPTDSVTVIFPNIESRSLAWLVRWVIITTQLIIHYMIQLRKQKLANA